MSVEDDTWRSANSEETPGQLTPEFDVPPPVVVLTVAEVEMIRELHAWMGELMPFARQAAKMMEKRQNLLGLVTGRANRRD